MKESDYIKVTNLAKARAAQIDVLSLNLFEGEPGEVKEWVITRRITEDLEKLIELLQAKVVIDEESAHDPKGGL